MRLKKVGIKKTRVKKGGIHAISIGVGIILQKIQQFIHYFIDLLYLYYYYFLL